MRRGGPRRLTTAGLVLIGVLAAPVPGRAADIFVNTTADTNDGNCLLTCSLRDAVMIANSNPGQDTIHLPAGVYNLTISGGGLDEQGDLDIFDDVDIEGSGADVTIIDGLFDEHVFEISDADASGGFPLLQLFDLTIRGAGHSAVRSEDAALYLWRCVIEENLTSTAFSPISSHDDELVLVVDSVIRDNSSSGAGGAIRINRSVLWVLRSTIADNRGDSAGGAVYCDGGSVTFTNSTVTGNSVSRGSSGGFWGELCDVLITGSTLAGNLQNDLELDQVHLSAVTVRNTYIGSVCPLGTANQVTSEGGNVGSTNCGFLHPSDINASGGTSILLPLGNYGGYTPTMPPFGVGYHPMVDNPGADANCLSDDQRGVSRPQDGGGATLACDTGAVERTHIFLDGFESGDTSAWSSTVP